MTAQAPTLFAQPLFPQMQLPQFAQLSAPRPAAVRPAAPSGALFAAPRFEGLPGLAQTVAPVQTAPVQTAGGQIFHPTPLCAGQLTYPTYAVKAAPVKAAKSSAPIFVINGFYMSMREKFTLADAKLHYFTVEFDAASLSWADFRGSVLGATDPATAEEGSLRRTILEQYEELGLRSQPNVGDNGMHASASPFEALAERLNWLSADLQADGFAQALLAAGVEQATIEAWTKDPQVPVDGQKGSLFDALEDLDSSECLRRAVAINGAGSAAQYGLNEAFVFIKPHAVTAATVQLVKETFAAKGIRIVSEGVLDGPTIGAKKLIDNHYYAIANKASLTKPAALNPPEAKQAAFQELFGLSWPAALKQGKVFNALDGCAKLGLSGDEMDCQWAKAKKAKQLVKFGGGFYAGLVDPKA